MPCWRRSRWAGAPYHASAACAEHALHGVCHPRFCLAAVPPCSPRVVAVSGEPSCTSYFTAGPPHPHHAPATPLLTAGACRVCLPRDAAGTGAHARLHCSIQPPAAAHTHHACCAGGGACRRRQGAGAWIGCRQGSAFRGRALLFECHPGRAEQLQRRRPGPRAAPAARRQGGLPPCAGGSGRRAACATGGAAHAAPAALPAARLPGGRRAPGARPARQPLARAGAAGGQPWPGHRPVPCRLAGGEGWLGAGGAGDGPAGARQPKGRCWWWCNNCTGAGRLQAALHAAQGLGGRRLRCVAPAGARRCGSDRRWPARVWCVAVLAGTALPTCCPLLVVQGYELAALAAGQSVEEAGRAIDFKLRAHKLGLAQGSDWWTAHSALTALALLAEPTAAAACTAGTLRALAAAQALVPAARERCKRVLPSEWMASMDVVGEIEGQLRQTAALAQRERQQQQQQQQDAGPAPSAAREVGAPAAVTPDDAACAACHQPSKALQLCLACKSVKYCRYAQAPACPPACLPACVPSCMNAWALVSACHRAYYCVPLSDLLVHAHCLPPAAEIASERIGQSTRARAGQPRHGTRRRRRSNAAPTLHPLECQLNTGSIIQDKLLFVGCTSLRQHEWEPWERCVAFWCAGGGMPSGRAAWERRTLIYCLGGLCRFRSTLAFTS